MTVCRRLRPVALVAATGFLAAFMSSCGGGSYPSTPTPTPTPTTQPAPPPVTGGDPFHHSSCPLGKGDENAACAKGRSAALLAEVESAMDKLVLERPQLFDLTKDPEERPTMEALSRHPFLQNAAESKALVCTACCC